MRSVSASSTRAWGRFISHQWLANQHPDPKNEQLQVLQEGLRNLLAGVAQVSQPVQSELFHGRMPCPTASDFKSTPLYVWYDFLCCPQDASECASRNRQWAISSIPSYVAKCKYFVVLCPALAHAEQRVTLSYETWTGRGWLGEAKQIARCPLKCRKGGISLMLLLLCTWSEFPKPLNSKPTEATERHA